MDMDYLLWLMDTVMKDTLTKTKLREKENIRIWTNKLSLKEYGKIPDIKKEYWIFQMEQLFNSMNQVEAKWKKILALNMKVKLISTICLMVKEK